MGNRCSTRVYAASAAIMLIMIMLSLTGVLLSTSKVVLGLDSVTGAIWTTDPDGERVNGNLYTSARKVCLCGGPITEWSAGLPDGPYYFQVTDPSGKIRLSTDDLEDRQFEVKDGYIFGIGNGTHKYYPDDTRLYGIVVQLWPFTHKPNDGGVYKVWVTHVYHYTEGQGSFGFIPSLSKTDNFKVKMHEVPKYFELWVTERISSPSEVEFYVNYTIESDGDPVLPWTTGRMFHHRNENGYYVFRYETSFAIGTYIYWQFFVSNSFTWSSVMHGPELIDQEGMVNQETLFIVDGHKYDYRDGSGLGGWTIELYRDGERIDATQTDPDGYYAFIGQGSGDYMVCEIAKTDQGWANATPIYHEFTVDGNNGGDYTFDFYNYKMLRISDTSDYRCELPSFSVVFTPDGDSGKYKLSSTNPGSFYTGVVKYGTPNTPVRIELSLSRDQENGEWFDSPNFIMHHTYIGSTSLVDVHVYAGRLDESPCGSEWVPDWEKDVTGFFNITSTADGKNATVEGMMPDTGEVYVTVHIDYQISASVTADQVKRFGDFKYTLSVTVYFSIQGVRFSYPIGP